MSSSSRTAHYQRFIPREEVQEVTSWEFKPVDGSAPEAAASATPDLTAEQQAAARQEAYDQGFEQGRMAGAQEVQAALQQELEAKTRELASRLSQLLQQADAHFDQLEQVLASQMLELACDLARQVVRRELSLPKEALEPVVREALALAVDEGRPAVLRLHPEDADWLQAGWAQTPPSTPIRLEPDASLSPGDCVLESSQGQVDGRVERRWTRAVANLGLNAPWQAREYADDQGP